MEVLQILVKSMERKQGIRKRILKKREALSAIDWEEKSLQIYEKVIGHSLFLEADEIYCYVDVRQEVDTHRIIKQAWKLGKKVAVPKIINGTMEFFYIQSFSELEKGYFQIPEPILTEEAAEGSSVTVVMPGVAFDRKKNRMGYGKGFYDRYLQEHTGYRTIALAFELQMLDTIPAESHDIRPDIIITEEHNYV